MDQFAEQPPLEESEFHAIAVKLAHDIRNPLGAIQGFASLLQGKEEDPKKRALLSSILKGCYEINQTLMTLTEFTKPLLAKKESVNLSRFLIDFLEEIRPLSETTAFALKLPPEEVSENVDLSLMKRALMELIRNALESSTPHITIGLTKTPLSLFIEDKGCGIPLRDQESLSKLFFTRKEQGRGLGLSLVKKIATLHEGSVEISSEEGKGTTVTISLGNAS